MDINFNGKVTLITGASSGLGEAIACLFSKCGASLAITGRKKENLQRVADVCKQLSPNHLEPFQITGDLCNEEDCTKTVNETINHYNRLDILVNNAGILVFGELEHTSLEDYDRQMHINVRSMYHMAQLCIPHIVKTKGNIVNISSTAGLRSFPSLTPYCMSKSSIDQMTRCAALELAPKQVRVNAVNPGMVKTDIHQRAGWTDDQLSTYLERCKTTYPLGRAGEPIEVASTVAFIASDHASFITGATIPVDGGKQVMCPR